tara:strand:+ start:346 stop:633 length:288 start_codon:yes stop_codon:yes gene_type:complete
MKLLTKELEKKLRENSKKRDGIAYVKFFNPTGAGTWWVSELDDNNIMYGMAHIFENELGYTALSDIQKMKCPPYGLPIERDSSFKPTPLKDCRND